MRHLTVGHSPDADDAFMFYALSHALVDVKGPEPVTIEPIHADIQSLNERASRGAYDVSQISAAAYPGVADLYRITACGSSMGENYGPVVVAQTKVPVSALAGRRVAVPGSQTTAFLLAQKYLPDFEPIQLSFDQVFEAVQDGRADAGVVIHEGQITYEGEGFVKIIDLGEAWYAETGLPLPLGINVVRRDLGDAWHRWVAAALAASIEYARTHPSDAQAYARAVGPGVDRDVAERFTAMYVTERTRDMGPEGREALSRLFSQSATNSAEVPVDVVSLV